MDKNTIKLADWIYGIGLALISIGLGLAFSLAIGLTAAGVSMVISALLLADSQGKGDDAE